jgi:hypothetical protein
VPLRSGGVAFGSGGKEYDRYRVTSSLFSFTP